MSLREPILPGRDRRSAPTQMTAGFREVEQKRKRWREHDEKRKGELLGSHMIPVLHLE